MSKNRILYMILFVLFSYIALIYFDGQREKMAIQKFGSIRAAMITDRPNCGRSASSVMVLLDNRTYDVEIGINKCIQGYYRIGDKVEVMYHPSFNRVILPTKNVKFGYIISILFFIVPLYLLGKLIFNFRRM